MRETLHNEIMRKENQNILSMNKKNNIKAYNK